MNHYNSYKDRNVIEEEKNRESDTGTAANAGRRRADETKTKKTRRRKKIVAEDIRWLAVHGPVGRWFGGGKMVYAVGAAATAVVYGSVPWRL